MPGFNTSSPRLLQGTVIYIRLPTLANHSASLLKGYNSALLSARPKILEGFVVIIWPSTYRYNVNADICYSNPLYNIDPQYRITLGHTLV